jgi:hypothetical protein
MSMETIFEIAGFITPQKLLYFRMLARYESAWVNHFEFVFEIRCSGTVAHEFLAIAEFAGQTPHIQFNLPLADPLEMSLLSCIAQNSIGPIIVCYDKDPEVYLGSLKAKGLREIGTATIACLHECFARQSSVAKE